MKKIMSLLCSFALLTGAVVVPSAAMADVPDGCPEPAPVSEVVPGTTATGWTVSSGITPEPFDVVVVDVLQHAIAPGVPLIVVETDSPAIDAAGGIWAGMSGSPVYLEDGRLLGAVGYGFSFGPSKLGGVTPAEAMLQVPSRPTLPPPLQPADADDASVPMPSQVRTMAAAEAGVSVRSVSSMNPLQVPVAVSGPTGQRFDELARAFERAHPGTKVVRSGGAGASQVDAGGIVPGGNLAVSLAFGDYNAVGVGTVTSVCDGVVTGFGHPMLWDGATRLGMHGARAVTVVTDPVMGPYKMANAGAVMGTIDQDRLAAVSGRLGAIPPTVAITSDITETDGGRTVAGRTDAIHPSDVFSSIISHGWTNYDSLVFDDVYFAGTSEVAWSIEGIRADGSPFRVERSNRHASSFDLSTASLFEVALDAQVLVDNPFEEVRLTAVDYEATAGSPYRSLAIQRQGVEISVDGGPYAAAGQGLTVEPGANLRIRVPLRLTRGATSTVVLTLDVPDDIGEAYGELLIEPGGADGDIDECLFFPEDCGGVPADSFSDLLDQIADRPRSDDLTASLYLEGESEHAEGYVPVATATQRVSEVVSGSSYLSVEVYDEGEPWEPEEWCPEGVRAPFADVGRGSTHHDAIACGFELGIVRGTAETPPRFLPADTVRRDQAAAFVARTLDLGDRELPDPGRNPFGDVGGTHRDDIARLHAAGIVRGTSPSTFDPRAEVTRQQMAALLMRALRWQTGEPLRPEGGPYFPDVGGTHARDVDASYELGLVRGGEDGRFRPLAPTRRDQMASLLVRFLDAGTER